MFSGQPKIWTRRPRGSSEEPRTSFRLKVAGAALVTTMTALALASLIFVVRQWRVEREELVQSRVMLAQVIAANASSPVLLRDGETARRLLATVKNVPGLRSAQMFDEEGRLVSRLGGGPELEVNGTTLGSWRFSRDTLEVRVPIRADQFRVGELVLTSGLEDLHRTFAAYALFVLALLGTVGAASLAIALFLARRVMAPVQRLTSAMSEVRESGDYARAVRPAKDVELARLTSEFNGLLSELDLRERRLNTAMVDLMESRDAAERANRLKTEFLANMSHEIRTPLNGVLGIAHLMSFDQLSPAQAERLGIIQRSGEELLELLNNVLDVAKIEAGQLKLECVPFDLATAITQACEASLVLAAEKGLRFELKTSPDLNGLWSGDPTRLRQVIRNLVSNAVKFTNTGSITVTADPIGGTSEGVVVRVIDTGVGIPADKLQDLFQKFVQADSSTTRSHGGSGLGLAICRELASLFGGSISVRSELGVGSEFTLRLPLARAAAQKAA